MDGGMAVERDRARPCRVTRGMPSGAVNGDASARSWYARCGQAASNDSMYSAGVSTTFWSVIARSNLPLDQIPQKEFNHLAISRSTSIVDGQAGEGGWALLHEAAYALLEVGMVVGQLCDAGKGKLARLLL